MSIENDLENPPRENSLENSQEGPIGRVLKFEGVGDKTVYNITKPFEFPDGHIYILGRVESKDKETDSQIMFFEEKENADSEKVWLLVEGAHIFEKMQDPFFSVIGGELIVGGVEIWDKAKWGDYMDIENEGFSTNSNEHVGYKTVFYKVTDVNNVEKIAEGPEGMKDIRLVDLEDKDGNKKIGVFTRPEIKEKEDYRRYIAYTEINSLDELNEKNIKKAKEIKNLFKESEWGGVNEAFLLGDGTIGVLGHKARFDEEGNKEYYAVAIVFVFNPETHKFIELEIVAEAKIFGDEYEPKRKDLENVIFPCGYNENSKTLYGGLGDRYPIAIKLENKLFPNHGGIVRRFIKNEN